MSVPMPRFARLDPENKARRARQIWLSIVLPPVLLLLMGGLHLIGVEIFKSGGYAWQIPVCLLVGFTFLVREFKIIAILFCWAYFFPMYLLTASVGVIVASIFFHP